MAVLVKNKCLAYVIRFFRRLIEMLTGSVLFLMYCGRSKKLADIEDPILLESALSLAAKIRRGEDVLEIPMRPLSEKANSVSLHRDF